MQVVIVYESMFGNTHLIADAIGQGFGPGNEVAVLPLDQASREQVASADLLVVGGPTHVHTMSRTSTRRAAVEQANQPDSGLTLDPDAEGDGLREWFDALRAEGGSAAAFDTRIDAPAALTGRASKGIAKRLRRHGYALVDPPKSFLVTKQNELELGEGAHARDWGAHLEALLTSEQPVG